MKKIGIIALFICQFMYSAEPQPAFTPTPRFTPMNRIHFVMRLRQVESPQLAADIRAAYVEGDHEKVLELLMNADLEQYRAELEEGRCYAKKVCLITVSITLALCKILEWYIS